MRFNPDAKLDPSLIDDRRGQRNPLVTPTARPPSAMSIVADVQRRMNTGLRRWSPGILGGRTDVASPVSPPTKSVLVPRVLANPATAGGSELAFSWFGTPTAVPSGPNRVNASAATLGVVEVLLGTAGSTSTVVTVYIDGVSIGTVTLGSGVSRASAVLGVAVTSANVVTCAVTTVGAGAASPTVFIAY